MKLKQIKMIIDRYIKEFKLDLTDLIIYTEVGTNTYIYPSLIAALAGATKVYALVKQPPTLETVNLTYTLPEVHDLIRISKLWGVYDKINVVSIKQEKEISNSDIITNLGNVRPITKEMIDWMKPTAVIPLMYDTWEFRETDIDLDHANEKEILCLGTDEEFLGLYKSNPYLLLKILLELGFSIWNQTFVFLGSSSPSTGSILDFFQDNFIEFYQFCKFIPSPNNRSFDAIIIFEMYHDDLIAGKDGWVNETNLEEFKDTPIIHISGNIDLEFCKKHNLPIISKDPVQFGHQTYTGDYLSPSITLKLLTAGLKVGEIMARLRKKNDYLTSHYEAIRRHLVMFFE